MTAAVPRSVDALPAPAGRRRLLWLIDSLNVGGAESLVVPFVRHHDRSRYELTLCCLTSIGGNPVEPEVARAGARIVNLGARSLRDVAAFRRLLELIREAGTDLMHAHLTYASTWAALAARITRVPAVATLHVAPPGHGREAIRDRLLRFALKRWAARTLTVSEALRQQYIRRGGLDASRLLTVHNGIDVTRFSSDRASSRRFVEREFAIPAGVPVVVTVSVLRPGKGIDILLQAVPRVLERHPDAVFLVVGDGPMREEWERLNSATGGGASVRWAGHRRDVDAILPGCDLFVLPSLADAFPTVLLEAMAAGLPAVATKVGGIPEIITPPSTGLLVPPEDAESLAIAIADLLADAAGRERMGEIAREEAARRFSIDAWLQRLDLVYDSLARQESRP